MRKLLIMQHSSLDGVMQHSPDGTDFPYSGWHVPFRSPEGMAAVAAAYGDTFDLVLGRHTYDLWSDIWGAAPSSPMADRISAATKFVATHRPDSLTWGPVRALGDDLVDGVRRVKAEDGPDLVLAGSSTLTSLLLGNGLADTVLLITYPIILGTGKRTFADGIPPQELTLDSTLTTPTGVTLAAYTVAGPLKPG